MADLQGIPGNGMQAVQDNGSDVGASAAASRNVCQIPAGHQRTLPADSAESLPSFACKDTSAWAAYPLPASLKIHTTLSDDDLETRIIKTSAGDISIMRNKEIEGAPYVLCFHHNSGSKEVFIKQFEGLKDSFNLIAIDFQGCGDSSAAKSDKQYSMKGYAQTAIEVADALGIDKFHTMGVSMGGHVAYELMHQVPNRVQSAFVTGSPPVQMSPDGFGKGFNMSEIGDEISHDEFTREDATKFVMMTGFTDDDLDMGFYIDKTFKAEAAGRTNMIASCLDGTGATNNDEILRDSDIAVGIVIGRDDTGINNAYIREHFDPSRCASVKMLEELPTGHLTLFIDPEGFNAHYRSFISKGEIYR